MSIKEGMKNRYSNIYKLIGDSLITVSSTITTFAIYEKVDWLGYVCMGTLVLGKISLNIAEGLKKLKEE